MAGIVEKINTDILRICREQIGLDILEVEKKIKKIAAIEDGRQKPTFNQLNTLAGLYKVPRWVFISDSLPKKYQFNKALPVFRKFAHDRAELFSDYKVRSLTARVEQLRDLILELRDDMGEPIGSFDAPMLDKRASADSTAQKVRKWLNSTENLEFAEWKGKLEERGIFVFMTSRYKGWSHIDRALFRGLAIYHSILPVIVINDSDSKKAQSFTLFHELGHLLRKESAIDDWADHHQKVERWCDELAGNILMPSDQFLTVPDDIYDLDTVKSIAKSFKASPYSCLVRLRQSEKIDQATYTALETQLKAEYAKLQKKLKESSGGPARNRSREVLKQYGQIYANALFQAYHNKEIGLHKLCKAFGLKRAAYVFEMGKHL